MSIEKVKEYFKNFDMENRIMEFDVSSETVKLAALALNCEEGKIAKTLSFLANDKVILIVTAGDGKVNNGKYKRTFMTKAKMLPHDETKKLTGHAAGGVCPFAVNDGVEVYLDVTLKKYETVFPACGSSNSAIELTIEEMEKYSNFVNWVDVCTETIEIK